MSRIGVFGGTFNPIHNGHVLLCEYCKRELSLDKVLLIPDNTPPHKISPDLASGSDRLQMCRLASKELPWLEVSDIELKREGKSYTYETLASLKELYPSDELFLITGADMFLTLHQWKNPEIIFNCASLIAVPRDSSDKEKLAEFYHQVIEPMGARAYILPEPVMEVSSTFIRDHIGNKAALEALLSPAVYEYICKRGLYQRVNTNGNDYQSIIRKMMGDYRFTHSVNVASEAVALAKLYGADEHKAYIAGILHDITKEIPHEEQLQIIKDGGIILDDVQKTAPKLWHSISGSVYIRTELGINDEDIINAIRYHTTGRAGMSLLEKIIYTADFTSAERNYNGADIMREKSRRSLEEAMIYSCQFTLQNLSAKEAAIHPDQFFCYNDLVLNRKG